MRLIDAEALKKALAKNKTIWTFNVSYDGILAEVINNTPTVEERPQGKWLKDKIAFNFVCSHCGCAIRALQSEVFEGNFDYNFCPNCGAKMEIEL